MSDGTDLADKMRFRWLTKDHADPETRAKCRDLLGRMGVMSYASACADIDAAMAADTKRSMLRTANAVIAAMRCFVAVQLGDEVDVPKELLK